MSKKPQGYFYLRHVAGEGGYHPYRQLKKNRRFFLFLKYLKTSLSYFFGRGAVADSAVVCFVKGGNQLRHHKYTASLRASRGCEGSLFVDASGLSSDEKLLPRFGWGAIVRQFFFLVLMLLSGRKRFLSLYFVEFYEAIEKSVGIGFSGVDVFVCYNDQPYDVAAIVCALNAAGVCKTIVIQHGLILSERFYFPANAKEFWAWGELSTLHYRSKSDISKVIVTGRYLDDSQKKEGRFIEVERGRALKVLVATSFFHAEFKDVVEACLEAIDGLDKGMIDLGYKLHPATKMKSRLRSWVAGLNDRFVERVESMEALAGEYDVLVTLNSTSAIDFLLAGKPVFFRDFNSAGDFPSHSYGFKLHELRDFLCGKLSDVESKNSGRICIINDVLNV